MLPDGANVVDTRLITKKKRTAVGEIEHNKASLVAQDFHQISDVEFFDTYTPVGRLTSFSIMYVLRFMPKMWRFLTQLCRKSYILNLSLNTLHYLLEWY